MPNHRRHIDVLLPDRADVLEFLQARGRVLVWLIVAGLVLTGLEAWELRSSYLDARNASQLVGKNLSQLLKEQLDGAFRETDLVLRDLVGKADPQQLKRLRQLTADERRAMHTLLDDKQATLPQVDSLAFLSPDGKWAVSTDKLSTAAVTTGAFFQQLKDNPGQELVFSPPLKLPGNRDMGFIVARRIPDEKGGLSGVVAALVTLEYFNQLARRLEAGDRSTLALVDTNLLLVGRYPEQADAIGKPLPNASTLANWVDGRSTGYAVMISPEDQIERGYSFRRLENFPFIVLIGLPESAYFSDWRFKAMSYGSTTLLLMLLGIAMIWRGWREAKLSRVVAASESRRREQDVHLLRVLEALSRPLMIVRARDNLILAANQATAQLCQIDIGSLQGTLLPSLYLRPEHHSEIVSLLNNHQQVTDYELKFSLPDGGAFWVGLSGSVIEYQGDSAYFISLQDISERKAALEKLWRKATIDPLTGIPNRGYFLERADQEWKRAKRYGHPLGVLILDLDHFKTVNDHYGHDAGDQVLRAFTARLKLELRESDLFGRVGGEEFAIVLPEEAEASVHEVAERLRMTLAGAPILLDSGEALSVTVSIGCALMQPDVPNLEALLKQADVALYAAKGAGRNRVMYYDPLSETE